VRKQTVSFVGKRFAQLVPQLLAISLATFLLIRLLPGDPARALLGPHATAEGIKQLSARMGLDQSLPSQYWVYLSGVVRGNLGYSWFTGQSVAKDLVQRAPATLELITYSLIVAIIVGISIGMLSAIRGNKGAVVRGLNWYSRLAGAFPDFWMGLLGIFVFFYVLHIAPAPLGRLGLTVNPPRRITGFYTIDSLVTGNISAFRDAAAHLVLPVLVLGLIVAPMIARVTSVAMSDALRSDYIRYARASGLSHSTIYRYAIRNSLPPVITIGGVLMVYLLGGAVLIEKVFSWGGIGQYAVQAVGNSDFAAIQGFVLLAATFTVLVYLVVDLLHSAIDPRVTH
jgi:ABC-type dipeptide/oligopeptide/nickel transport system permease component